MESDLPDLTYEPSVSDSAPLLPLYSRTSRTSEDDSRGNDLHNRLKLRQLQPADLAAVKSLCYSSFPIQYPECWFNEVVSSNSLISYGFFDSGRHLCALIVAEVKSIAQCNAEDREIVPYDPSVFVVYILSLAVDAAYRRMGLATRLLQHLFDIAVNLPPYPKAVFLHVLSTNYQAVKFYKANGNYYRFDDGFGDGCTYVKYANGARPPRSMQEMCRYVTNAFAYPARVFYKMFVHD
ncbi:hypothetical protein WR25_13647 [Diploscapter pachys]|uniref:N-alpha-acetyltransferase 60 n=1 Tax=Diploscapter pachys TaxID=2018661 RepID=A0A2A2KRE2_9BILA|nr:hypothetical protein WR25_13647 [Diploscapter pachys]